MLPDGYSYGKVWRRERDSNPRWGCPQTAFPIRPRGGIGRPPRASGGQMQVSGGILRDREGSEIPPKAPPVDPALLSQLG